jgi:hypothetical protein
MALGKGCLKLLWKTVLWLKNVRQRYKEILHENGLLLAQLTPISIWIHNTELLYVYTEIELLQGNLVMRQWTVYISPFKYSFPDVMDNAKAEIGKY